MTLVYKFISGSLHQTRVDVQFESYRFQTGIGLEEERVYGRRGVLLGLEAFRNCAGSGTFVSIYSR